VILPLFACVVLLASGALIGVCGTLVAVAWRENRDGVQTWQLIRDLRRGKRRLRRAVEHETKDETRRENRE